MSKIKLYYKNAPLQCVIFGIVLVFGSLIFSDEVSPIYKIIMLIIFTSFIVTIAMTTKYKDYKYTIGVSQILSIILLLGTICNISFAILSSFANQIENPEVNINDYEKYFNKEMLKVFPAHIPKTATDTHFFYISKVLQGGEMYALYYYDLSINTEEFDNKYRQKAKWIGSVNELKEANINLHFDYTPISENDNYKIYVISNWCDNSGWCNHGEFKFAAINDKNKQIVFKYENW